MNFFRHYLLKNIVFLEILKRYILNIKQL